MCDTIVLFSQIFPWRFSFIWNYMKMCSSSSTKPDFWCTAGNKMGPISKPELEKVIEAPWGRKLLANWLITCYSDNRGLLSEWLFLTGFADSFDTSITALPVRGMLLVCNRDVLFILYSCVILSFYISSFFLQDFFLFLLSSGFAHTLVFEVLTVL